MNKLELIAILKNEHRISRKEAATVLGLFFGNIATALAKG